MSKFSKLIKEPKKFFQDFFKKNYLEKNLKVKSIFKFSFKGNLLIEKSLIYFFIALIPILFSYYYLIARDRYLVTSSIVLRSALNNNITNDFNSLFMGLRNQANLNESKYLEVYLKSPEMFRKIEKNLNFSYASRKKGIDLFSGLNLNANNDEKYKFFKKQISIFTNQGNGILEIKVNAFSPKDAQSLNQFLINQSEIFVNDLNYKISKKKLEFTRNQVNLAKQRLDLEKDRLRKFQTKYKSIDLESESVSISKIIIALEEEIIKLKIKLLDRKRTFINDDAPEIKFIENQIKSLREQIELERGKLVNESEYGLNQKSLELKEIKNNILFFEELYKTILAKTESNRIDSIQQQIFLATLSKPTKPEQPWQFWRHRGFLTYISLVVIISASTKFIFGITMNHKA